MILPQILNIKHRHLLSTILGWQVQSQLLLLDLRFSARHQNHRQKPRQRYHLNAFPSFIPISAASSESPTSCSPSSSKSSTTDDTTATTTNDAAYDASTTTDDAATAYDAANEHANADNAASSTRVKHDEYNELDDGSKSTESTK